MSFVSFGGVQARDRIKLAVMDFHEKNTSPENAEAVTDLLRTALFNTGRFVVIERDRIQQIIEEQKFQSTGYTDMDQAVEIGRLLNVQKIMVGTVNKLGDTFVINTRMVDVMSGVVDVAVSKKSTGGESNLPDAIEEFALMIVDRIGLEGAIIRLEENRVLIDLGSRDGARHGQVFDVLRKGETIRDLKGRVIGTEYEEMGSVEITNVEDGFSEVRVREGSGSIELGDIVRSVPTEQSDYGDIYPVENAWYKIVGMHSEKCIDVKDSETNSGANVQIYSWHGKANQLWMFVRSGPYFRIVSKNSGKCLDVKGASKNNGANIQQSEYHGGDNQLWKLESVGEYFKIISKKSGKCLDVKGYSKENGANVQQFSCNGGSNQLWKIEQVE